MKSMIGSIRKAGFTLIEVLVTVVVIGVLAAVVIPAVTAQVTAGDSARVLSDLNNVRTGIENFDIAVRQFPGDVDDLVNLPGTVASSGPSSSNPGAGTSTDADLTGTTYLTTGLNNWKGPYVEANLPTGATSSTLPNPSVAAFNTGYNATINNAFQRCAITTSGVSCSTTSGDYVVVEIDNLTSSQAGSLNDLIDGVGESASSTAGKFRTTTSGTAILAYYFATPFK